jgi:hypothetical protein
VALAGEENLQKVFNFFFWPLHSPHIFFCLFAYFLFWQFFKPNIEPGQVDRLHTIVLATSHVALGGEENFQKAFEFLRTLNAGPGGAELATQQLDILKSQRDRLLSEGMPTKGKNPQKGKK